MPTWSRERLLDLVHHLDATADSPALAGLTITRESLRALARLGRAYLCDRARDWTPLDRALAHNRSRAAIAVLTERELTGPAEAVAQALRMLPR